MLLGVLSILIMMAVAYAYLREGLFTAFVMCCNVVLAGLLAFNFWEPLADLLQPLLSGTFLQGYEDAFCLVLLFSLTLGLLRTATNALANTIIQFPPVVQRGGGFGFGLLAGYLVAGFLLCVLQTLPWHENFMFFDPQYETGPEHALRRVLPPDRVWLSMMFRAGAFPFANNETAGRMPSEAEYDKYVTFDRFGTFELRYARYRRYADSREPVAYQGELDPQLDRGAH